MRILILVFLIFFGTLSANPLDPLVRSQINVHVYYSKMIDYYQNEEWQKLAWKCEDLIADFPTGPFAREALYYLGVAEFKLEEYEYANKAFSNYLKEELTPKFFEQTIRFKFEIATEFDRGARLHLFGWNRMPKWLPAYEEAIEIYDEVITTMPRDDLAAKSLYRKGVLLLRMEEYKKSVEAFQTLSRRFPKHPLAPHAYVGIADVYLSECRKKFPDSNKFELAEINLRKFKAHFPREPRIEEAYKRLLGMKEELANDLLEVAEFYERTKKGNAAAVYYGTILKKYPETKAAKKSEKRLKVLGVHDIYSKKKSSQEDTFIVDNTAE
ncbi:MAG: outer membrane protein assembly factor BamD [Candidatus Neptunochlamydia sp.]|nr:outer membrane protein assembly factor BamD [Candidatus Neptunochlamydia sp.]